MTVEYVQYRISASDRDAFEAAHRRTIVRLASAAECLGFELTRCENDRESYILCIRWTPTEAHPAGVRSREAFREFLFEIQPYVAAIEETWHSAPTGIEGRAAPTLYEWAGGAPAFERLFTTFYQHVADDEVLAPVFSGMDPAHPRHVAAWLAEVFGGPTRYSGERGGHRHMVGRHLGRAITERQRRRWVALLIDTADEVGLPDDPEFRAAFVGYLEWGTRMAMVLSQPGVTAEVPEPMPTWGWGERRPWSQRGGDGGVQLGPGRDQ
ncbi:group II truncated hemoglobin [Actinokineospora sp.]|uniref:group II truncated hemoglobin n=1 Tax=Actinokineospora sp. TaxID=1872133 RepID=UPI00403779A0